MLHFYSQLIWILACLRRSWNAKLQKRKVQASSTINRVDNRGVPLCTCGAHALIQTCKPRWASSTINRVDNRGVPMCTSGAHAPIQKCLPWHLDNYDFGILLLEVTPHHANVEVEGFFVHAFVESTRSVGVGSQQTPRTSSGGKHLPRAWRSTFDHVSESPLDERIHRPAEVAHCSIEGQTYIDIRNINCNASPAGHGQHALNEVALRFDRPLCERCVDTQWRVPLRDSHHCLIDCSIRLARKSGNRAP